MTSSPDRRSNFASRFPIIQVLVVLLFATSLPAFAQSLPLPIPLPGAGSNLLPSGTSIPVVVAGGLSSASAHSGQSVTFRVFRDIALGQTVVIPAGTLATGTVQSAHSAGAFGRAGELQFTCDSLTIPGGQQVPVKLDNSFTINGSDSSGGALAGGLLVGALVGAVAYAGTDFKTNFLSSNPDHSAPAGAGIAAGLASGLIVGALVHGGQANVPAGQHFSIVLIQNLLVPESSDQGNSPSNTTAKT